MYVPNFDGCGHCIPHGCRVCDDTSHSAQPSVGPGFIPHGPCFPRRGESGVPRRICRVRRSRWRWLVWVCFLILLSLCLFIFGFALNIAHPHTPWKQLFAFEGGKTEAAFGHYRTCARAHHHSRVLTKARFLYSTSCDGKGFVWATSNHKSWKRKFSSCHKFHRPPRFAEPCPRRPPRVNHLIVAVPLQAERMDTATENEVQFRKCWIRPRLSNKTCSQPFLTARRCANVLPVIPSQQSLADYYRARGLYYSDARAQRVQQVPSKAQLLARV